ncbi:MAG: hypothetical protein ISQ06_07690 [Planctomycetaceae bacterium]|nr:hypothetical protein [Planctomycetaceae bacterium]
MKGCKHVSVLGNTTAGLTTGVWYQSGVGFFSGVTGGNGSSGSNNDLQPLSSLVLKSAAI